MTVTENYHEWTSCEVYGHQFEASEESPNTRVCHSCGETYTED
jgi:hypothetical protein